MAVTLNWTMVSRHWAGRVRRGVEEAGCQDGTDPESERFGADQDDPRRFSAGASPFKAGFSAPLFFFGPYLARDSKMWYSSMW